MLTYPRTDTLEVVGFSDSDYAGYVDDKKSTFGYIYLMSKGVISWKSVKQTLTTSSNIEAKYVACYEATCHAIWLWNCISALEVVHSNSRPLKLFCDNSAIVSFSRNTRNTSRSKHIDVKFFFVKEKVTKFLISVEYTPMTGMLTNPLTKGLPICVFQEHVTRMGLLVVQTLCFSRSFTFFMYFVKKTHVFSLLHAHFDVRHCLMILCHFD